MQPCVQVFVHPNSKVLKQKHEQLRVRPDVTECWWTAVIAKPGEEQSSLLCRAEDLHLYYYCLFLPEPYFIVLMLRSSPSTDSSVLPSTQGLFMSWLCFSPGGEIVERHWSVAVAHANLAACLCFTASIWNTLRWFCLLELSGPLKVTQHRMHVIHIHICAEAKSPHAVHLWTSSFPL